MVLKGKFQKFDPLNRNPPNYHRDPIFSKNLIRLRKIKKIFNDKAREI